MEFLKDLATYIGILFGIFGAVYHLVQTVSKVRQMNILLSDLSILDPRLQTIFLQHLPLLIGSIVLVAFCFAVFSADRLDQYFELRMRTRLLAFLGKNPLSYASV